MNLQLDVERLLLAHKVVRAELLAERAADGYWAGQIGSSPVATAAAVSALVVSHRQDSDVALREIDADDQDIAQLVQGDLSELLFESLHWIARRQNNDGGWGDCDGADSNIAATMLVQAAFRLTGIPGKYADLMALADDFVAARNGVAGLRRLAGGEKTYLAPILANCALADMLPWRQVPALQFEWLSLPGRWQRDLYAPAADHLSPIVLAVGLAKFHNDPPHNPVTRLARMGLQKRSLARLAHLQGADDSFLASPLVTAFVVMSLASMGLQEHLIVTRGVEFLLSSVRADASWAVSTAQSTVNSALALGSLTTGEFVEAPHELHAHDRDAVPVHWEDTATPRDTIDDLRPARLNADAGHDTLHHSPAEEVALNRRGLEWLLKTQHVFASPLTEAPAGGWGAGDAAGAEPNTIATGAALVAIRQFYETDADTNRRIEQAASAGVSWLLGLQNEDGGWATLGCDSASGVDPTVHAMRALAAWQPAIEGAKCNTAIARAMTYLEAAQREDGSFIPMWFGNSHQRENENPVIGTSLVLTACAELRQLDSAMAIRAATWLAGAQHSCGGWGPPRAPVDYSESDKEGGVRSWRENEMLAKFCSVEETSVAVTALLPFAATNPTYQRTVSRGLSWLADSVEHDGHRRPAIVGFYFWRIWYYERLYPLALAAGALSRAVGALAPAATAEPSLNSR
jgi:squalene-hopene/tetraprenyl-beta-curcumene cyclase